MIILITSFSHTSKLEGGYNSMKCYEKKQEIKIGQRQPKSQGQRWWDFELPKDRLLSPGPKGSSQCKSWQMEEGASCPIFVQHPVYSKPCPKSVQSFKWLLHLVILTTWDRSRITYPKTPSWCMGTAILVSPEAHSHAAFFSSFFVPVSSPPLEAVMDWMCPLL